MTSYNFDKKLQELGDTTKKCKRANNSSMELGELNDLRIKRGGKKLLNTLIGSNPIRFLSTKLHFRMPYPTIFILNEEELTKKFQKLGLTSNSTELSQAIKSARGIDTGTGFMGYDFFSIKRRKDGRYDVKIGNDCP